MLWHFPPLDEVAFHEGTIEAKDAVKQRVRKRSNKLVIPCKFEPELAS
jgi:hypothetical protein